MQTSTRNIFLPLDFGQLLELVRQLPKEERRQLYDILLKEEVNGSIPEEHKQLVRTRIQKYKEHPELLIDEERAIELINNM